MMANPETLQGVFTEQALPDYLLQPFVSHYVYRRLSVPSNSLFEKQMPFRLANSIDFFIGAPYETTDCITQKTVPFTRCTIRGPRTKKKYSIRLPNDFISFTIIFQPTGMYRLLGLPVNDFTDKSTPTPTLDLIDFDDITDQMLNAPDINTCINMVEYHLLSIASKCRFSPLITESIAQKIIRQNGLVSVGEMAKEACLSVRQLERNFIREIGVSPKIYSNMLRLQHLIKRKIKNPELKWGSLAYEYNYYDHMHFIKDFRHYLAINPSEFAPSDFAF